VLNAGGDLGLLLEALQQVLERDARGGEALEPYRLDRDQAAELLVPGLVDGAEGARAELLLDHVAVGDLGRFRRSGFG
jgi:hypothetical protein